ncbi:SDR family oxidoreductase [Galbibacter sp. PAP.153]|uniref:SDR family oxidoreductase n=1 Tax=Galbibacter sp. PAP.153 TaxID=3104623 RepID=UPI003008309D
MNNEKVWLVTGASKGLGLVLVQKLLNKGYKVAATSRNKEALLSAVGEGNNFLPLQVDLLSEQSVLSAIKNIIQKFGKIDVIVNNAGYGQIGTLEELTDREARQNFEVNVFGCLNVIRNAMPHLRANKGGSIFNISSIAGFIGTFPGWGIYCATKYAVVGFTEALAAEVKSFGISATIVYPGYFRTNFLQEDSLSRPKKPISDYTEARELELKHINEIQGNQLGDPEKAATVLIEVAENGNPPQHLFLGQDSYDMAHAKLEQVQKDMTAYRALATTTAYDR